MYRRVWAWQSFTSAGSPALPPPFSLERGNELGSTGRTEARVGEVGGGRREGGREGGNGGR